MRSILANLMVMGLVIAMAPGCDAGGGTTPMPGTCDESKEDDDTPPEETVVPTTDCTIRPLARISDGVYYHRGGHARHNYCADHGTGGTNRENRYWQKDKVPACKGGDAVLGGKSFDAYVYWLNSAMVKMDEEVDEWKVGRWGSWKCEPHQIRYLQRTINDAELEYAIAKKCGFKYALIVTDSLFYYELKAHQPSTKTDPRLLKTLRMSDEIPVVLYTGCPEDINTCPPSRP